MGVTCTHFLLSTLHVCPMDVKSHPSLRIQYLGNSQHAYVHDSMTQLHRSRDAKALPRATCPLP